jgi:hypothetical protein
VPFFRFIVHGTGNFPGGIAGFYTTRWSWARTQAAAESKVLKQVKRGLKGSLKRDAVRTLEIEEARQISTLEIWRMPNRGYTFYSESD